MKILVNTLNSKIETDNPDILDALYRLYSEKAPGYQYSPAYKRRQWDGNVHFIARNGTFRTGLLTRILEDLKKIECDPEIVFEENSNISKYDENYTINNFKYYDYQKELIERGLSDMRGIIKSPTGSGKTLIMAGLVKALAGRKMVLLFNAKQLLTQSYDFLTKTCGMDNIGLCFGEGYIYGDIMLCTVQSIEKILDTHLEEAEVLMVDECHEFGNGKTTLAALKPSLRPCIALDLQQRHHPKRYPS
jgi:superfamily II DNA or RNA helicase